MSSHIHVHVSRRICVVLLYHVTSADVYGVFIILILCSIMLICCYCSMLAISKCAVICVCCASVLLQFIVPFKIHSL